MDFIKYHINIQLFIALIYIVSALLHKFFKFCLKCLLCQIVDEQIFNHKLDF